MKILTSVIDDMWLWDLYFWTIHLLTLYHFLKQVVLCMCMVKITLTDNYDINDSWQSMRQLIFLPEYLQGKTFQESLNFGNVLFSAIVETTS